MSARLKLTAGAFVVAASIGYLAFLGAANSWQYYLSVDETVADAANLKGKRIRVSGRVTPDSLKISEGRCEAEFDIAGARKRLHISCRCAMPDNLAEDIDVVVEGVLQDDRLLGHKVITRCASKYERREALAERSDMTSGSTYR
jgi:cytochrome c-type biogenesis protein CcmE